MRIAVLGAGNIGRTLGKKWLDAGHQVIFGVRDPQSPKAQTCQDEIGPEAGMVSFSEAVDFSEVVLFSIPWAAVPETVAANEAGLDGKILIDATNNFGGPVINNLSALQKGAPAAKVYRVFNSLGWDVFANPILEGQRSDHFYCGPDGTERMQVEGLIRDVGLRPIWVGDLDRIELVDQLGALWVTLAMRQRMGRRVAIKLLGG